MAKRPRGSPTTYPPIPGSLGGPLLAEAEAAAAAAAAAAEFPLSSDNCNLANTWRTSLRLLICADTATAFLSSAKVRMLCSMGVKPSSLGNHQRSHDGSRKNMLILLRSVMGWMYLRIEE